MMSAFTTLVHNQRVIDKAESIIQKFAESEHCYLYLVNPDGTRVRILPGCKIESYEMIPIYKERD